MPEATVSIFNNNLIKDSRLANLITHLTGKNLPKPFECVGTIREIKAALHFPQDLKILLKDWGHDEFIPKDLQVKLKSLIHV